MSRLDRHVAMVQNKLALGRFVQALAWAGIFFFAAVAIGTVVYRMSHYRLPHLAIWLWSGVGICFLYALIVALVRRPTQHDAAVAIDERLALKEKFSTALFARAMKDPFAAAAVKDAEATAENVSLYKRFPLEFPREGAWTIGAGLLALMALWLFPTVNLFGREEPHKSPTEQKTSVDDAKKSVEKALQVIVDAQAKGVADEDSIKQAKKELQAMLNAPIRDPEKTKRSAARALSDVDQAIKQQIGSNQKIADAENDAKAFKSLTPADNEKGPVADAQRQIAKGDFTDAVDQLDKAVDKFDKMTEEEKKKTADQMQKMAQQLQQMAQNNPQAQQKMQQQLQQAGLNQQQAQKAQQLMQQAAQGDKQAQQQLQQMAQQAMKQMNQGQGPNQQQQQQMQQQLQQAMKQAQAQANTQQQAQQMAQAAQQMAQAMKQQAQGGQQGQGQGQQQQQQQQQQMAQGKGQMQQQLQAMQAMKADAQQVAAAQAAAAQAAAAAAQGLNNNGGQNPGPQANGQGNWQGQGQFGNNQKGQFKGPNQGRGGGPGAGDRTFKEQAPYAVKQEISESQDIDGGKILASSMIKAKSEKGQSNVGNESVAPPPEQDATDEVEQERISRPAQEAVKEYFSAWQKDANAAGPSPAPAPSPAQAPPQSPASK